MKNFTSLQADNKRDTILRDINRPIIHFIPIDGIELRQRGHSPIIIRFLQNIDYLQRIWLNRIILRYKDQLPQRRIKKKKPLNFEWLFRDSCRIQTCNLLIRSQMLYSVELRSLSLKDCLFLSFFRVAKVHKFYILTKFIFIQPYNILLNSLCFYFLQHEKIFT